MREFSGESVKLLDSGFSQQSRRKETPPQKTNQRSALPMLPHDANEISPGPKSPDDGRLVRPCARADFAELEAILKESGLTFVLPALPPLDAIPAFGAVAVLVCEFQRTIVGMIAWRELGGEVEILDLAIHPNYRRHGHGFFLLKTFVQNLCQSAVQKIFLEVRESNAAALALYRKLGFQISGRRPNYYRKPEENALLMTLWLRA